MATYTGVVAVHKTLTANAVDTVTLTGAAESITVLNHTGTDKIYVSVADVGGTPTPTPTVGGNDCYVLPAVVGSLTISTGGAPVVVSLISASALAYSVEGV